MFCTKCGNMLPDNAPACPSCGAGAPATSPMQPTPFSQQGAGTPVSAAPPTSAAQPYAPPSQAGNVTQGAYNPKAAGQMPQDAAPAGGAYTPPPYATGPSPVYSQQPQQTPQPAFATGGPAGMPKQTKKLPIPVILTIIGVVIFALAGILALTLSGGGPKSKVKSAVAKTFSTLGKEQETFNKNMGFAEVFKDIADQPFKTEYTIEADIPDAGRMTMSTTAYADFKSKKMDGDVTVGIGSASMFTANYLLDDDLFSVNAPGVFSGSYGFHTRTLGADFNRSALSTLMGGSLIDEDLSIDLFEVTDKTDSATTLDPETVKAVQAYGKTLWEAVSVAEDGVKNFDEIINDIPVQGKSYLLILPKEALVEYLSAMAGTLAEDPYMESVLDSLYAINDSFDLEYIAEWAEDSLDDDVTMQFFISGGEVRRLVMDFPVDGTLQTLTFELGGENALSDAVRISGHSDGMVVFDIYSEGDMLMKSGAFTNNLTITSTYYGTSDTITMTTTYNPSKESDNFSLAVSVPGSMTRISMAGTLTVDARAKSLKADFYDTVISTGGENNNISFSYAIEPAKDHTFSSEDPTMIFEMSDQELYSLAMEIATGLNSLESALT